MLHKLYYQNILPMLMSRSSHFFTGTGAGVFSLPLTVTRCEMFLDCSLTYVKIALMLLISVADSSDFFRVGAPFLVVSGAPLGERTSCVFVAGSFFLKKVLGLDSGLDSLDFMVAVGSFDLL